MVRAAALMHAAIGTAVTSVPEPKADAESSLQRVDTAKKRWPIRC